MDIIVTATGNKDIVKEEHFMKMKDKAIVCNIGHFELSLSYDHRIIDGAEAARFNNELKENLGKNFAYKLAV